MGLLRKKSTVSNLLFQMIYQILIWVLPLIVAPYLTRKLGDIALGNYTYVNSIAYYFLIFANLGITKYGQRIIAEKKDDIIELRKTFWSIYVNHIISSMIAILAFVLYVYLFVASNKLLYIAHLFYVGAAVFDVTWLFQGLENFKSVAIRNTIVKLVETVSIFVFVKSSSDILVYTLIMCVGASISQIILLPQVIREIKPIRVTINEIKKHTRPLFYFFAAVIAITLYTVVDKTLLGIMTTAENVAYYEFANRIINVPKAIISILAATLFPKICYLISSGRKEESYKYFNISITVTSMLAFGAMFGIAAIGQEFAVVYYGDTFAETGKIMICMAPLIYILSIGDIIRLQYMIPNHKDKAYLICSFMNASINLVLSFLLIPNLGVYGAIIGTFCAELAGLLFQIVYSRKNISIKTIMTQGLPFFGGGILMFILLKILESFVEIGIKGLCIKIFIGMVFYMSFSIAYLLVLCRDRRIYRQMIAKVLKKVKSN